MSKERGANGKYGDRLARAGGCSTSQPREPGGVLPVTISRQRQRYRDPGRGTSNQPEGKGTVFRQERADGSSNDSQGKGQRHVSWEGSSRRYRHCQRMAIQRHSGASREEGRVVHSSTSGHVRCCSRTVKNKGPENNVCRHIRMLLQRARGVPSTLPRNKPGIRNAKKEEEGVMGQPSGKKCRTMYRGERAAGEDAQAAAWMRECKGKFVCCLKSDKGQHA